MTTLFTFMHSILLSVAAFFFYQVNLFLYHLIKDKRSGENGVISGFITVNVGLWIAGLLNTYESAYRLYGLMYNKLELTLKEAISGICRIAIFVLLILGFHKVYFGLRRQETTNDSISDTEKALGQNPGRSQES